MSHLLMTHEGCDEPQSQVARSTLSPLRFQLESVGRQRPESSPVKDLGKIGVCSTVNIALKTGEDYVDEDTLLVARHSLIERFSIAIGAQSECAMNSVHAHGNRPPAHRLSIDVPATQLQAAAAGPGISRSHTGSVGSEHISCWKDLADRSRLQYKVFVDIVRRKAWVWLCPLLLLSLLCGLGVLGVMLAAERYIESQQDYAREAIAGATANTVADQLEIATFAVMTLSVYLTHRPSCAELDRDFNNISKTILDWDTDKLVYQVQALPAGVLQHIYPPVDAELAKLLIGRDVLKIPAYRNDSLYQIRSRNDRLLLGPYALLEGFQGIFVSYPIFLPAPDPSFDWGCGVQPYECPPGVCWLPAEGLKFWGLAFGLISLDNMQDGFRFRTLVQQGYDYRLQQLADDVNRATLISASAQLPRDAVVATINKFNLVWVLEVAPTAGWVPAWRDPCIAAVVVGSVVVCALVLWLLVTREKHNMLLTAMLPAKVIKKLQRGEQTVVEEFREPVTILFTDIVSYTEVASQMSPLQVVRLLNELYTHFDALTDKHGVYKVETIGDAFMCVSGCPTHEDPVKAAVRMAGMAQDMISTVRKFRTRVGEEEMQVQIRIGLHSGPVVAGVIGQRMPRYCLFGDAVNCASRMESNSAPMCINVSNETAVLLRAGGATLVPAPRGPLPPMPPTPQPSDAQLFTLPAISGQQEGAAVAAAAPDEEPRKVAPGKTESGSPPPTLMLHSRGRVMVKGKGPMACYWLGSPPALSELV